MVAFLKKTFEIEGLKIEAMRKRVQNARLYISQKNLQIHLTIPFRASEKFAFEFASKNIGWLKKTLEKMKANPSVLHNLPPISKEEIETLKKHISNMLPIWELKLGVKVKKWKLRKMTSQWGNCKTKTGEITFNIALIKKPFCCIEYVVAHELAHLLVANHSKKFYAIIAKYLPNWSETRKELNK
jgi:predicted metal-dependent hydrolase